MELILMKCGCQPQGTDQKTGKPVCIVHAGIKPGFDEVDDSPPSLGGRTAKCTYCNKTNPSDQPMKGYTVLPFFVHHPDREYDEYYCGCYGWD